MKKNNLQTALNKLKRTVFSKQKNQSSKVMMKFEIVEDMEGQTLHYPILEVGAPVTIGDNEGGEVAPDGWYAIEEGVEILVADGIINEIVQPVIEEDFEEVAEDEVTVDEELIKQIAELVEAVEAEIDSIQEEVKELSDSVGEFKKMDKNVKALTDAVAKFSKNAVATSVTRTEGVKDKQAELADFIANKRKNK